MGALDWDGSDGPDPQPSERIAPPPGESGVITVQGGLILDTYFPRMYPRFSYVRDYLGRHVNVLGFNEGICSFWFYQQQAGSRPFPSAVFNFKYVNNDRLYQVTYNDGTSAVFRRDAPTVSTILYSATPINQPVVDRWGRMRVQWRYTTPARVALEIKVWFDSGDGNGWIEFTPEGGVIDTSPHAPVSTVSIRWGGLGYSPDVPLGFQGFYSGFRLGRLSNDPFP